MHTHVRSHAHAHACTQVGGIPSDDEAVADGLQLLLLDYFGRDENPMVSSGRVKELLMKWHYLLAPGRE